MSLSLSNVWGWLTSLYSVYLHLIVDVPLILLLMGSGLLIFSTCTRKCIYAHMCQYAPTWDRWNGMTPSPPWSKWNPNQTVNDPCTTWKWSFSPISNLSKRGELASKQIGREWIVATGGSRWSRFPFSMARINYRAEKTALIRHP